MYDYFFDQWGTYSNVSAISSTLYQNLHTYLTSSGWILQETPGVYLDVSTPVLTSWVTGWINPAGLRGFQRFYSFYFVGDYISPHVLQFGIAYDYNPGISQVVTVNPNNFTGTFGSDTIYGGSQYFGGVTNVEDWRIFPKKQKCQAFQISYNEYYDSSFGVQNGAGLELSGLCMTLGIKKSYAPSRASTSTG